MAKRPHGSGSLYRLPSGRWRALVTVKGKRISHISDTQKEANQWIRETVNQVEQGLTYSSAKITVGDFLDEWICIKQDKVRPATIEQYQRLVRIYLKPGLGYLKLKDLSAAGVQKFYSQLQNEGIGRRTVSIINTVLHGALKHAQRLGLVTQNWAALVEVPRPPRREMKVWDESQVNQFLSYAPDNAFYRLAFATGMRRGELIGLKWIDLDWVAETIIVRRQVAHPQGGGWRFQEPKTVKGRRVIRLGPGLIAALRDHFNHEQPLARELAGSRWQEHDLIFPTSIGTPRNGYEVSKTFKKLAQEAGLPAIRFHDIRHTAASIMLLHRSPPVRVAAILGQSVAVLLDTYAHYIPDDQEAEAALMDMITSPTAIELGVKDRAQIAHDKDNKAKDIDD
jgi:integrase